jgi:hypothetical protein
MSVKSNKVPKCLSDREAKWGELLWNLCTLFLSNFVTFFTLSLRYLGTLLLRYFVSLFLISNSSY